MAPSLFTAESPARGGVVLAHGAGAGQRHPFMLRMAQGLAKRGLHVLTFDFPYMEVRRKAPDPAHVLEESFAAAVRRLRDHADVAQEFGDRKLPIFAGGKSMGGRIASQAAAKGLLPDVRGLFFLGYPLHPPGKPEQRRDAHLPDVSVPMLFMQGSRDAFGTPEELQPVLDRLGDRATLFVIEGGDHSFAVPKSAGSRDHVLESVLERLGGWMSDRI
jgi:predicted alpha/beta-hydrolase family hydrolase